MAVRLSATVNCIHLRGLVSLVVVGPECRRIVGIPSTTASPP